MTKTHPPQKQIVKGSPGANRPLRRILVFWAVYLVAVAAVFALENSEELLEGVPGGESFREQVAKLASKYQRFSLAPRPVEAHYVALLSINDASEGTLGGPCAIRALTAKLLPRIVDAGAALIASDIAFVGKTSSDTCPEDAPETFALIKSVHMAAASTPIVLAQGSLSLDQMKDEEAEDLRHAGWSANDLLLRPPLFPEDSDENVQFGLIRPNRQVEKVPLVWQGRYSEKGAPEVKNSLALTVAETYRSTFPDGGARLKAFEKTAYHPVTALLKEREFPLVPVIQAICDEKHAAAHAWKDCGPTEGNPKERAKLRGRIVVLGFSDDRNDLWTTNAGKLPGYSLHANYIEALLDARAYRVVGLGMRLLLSFAWAALIELPFWRHEYSTLRVLLLSALVSLVVIFLMNYVALVNFDTYIGLFAPSVLLVGARVVDRLAEHILEPGH